MGKHRRQFSAELKAKIAVEALKGQRTVQEIASSYSVHPNQVTNWKKQVLDFSPEAFASGRALSDQADERSRCSADRGFEFFNLPLLKVAQAARHMQVVPDLVQRCPRSTQELHSLPGVMPRSSFHDIRRHGQRRTTQL